MSIFSIMLGCFKGDGLNDEATSGSQHNIDSHLVQFSLHSPFFTQPSCRIVSTVAFLLINVQLKNYHSSQQSTIWIYFFHIV